MKKTGNIQHKFLADLNISPKTVEFLKESLGLDVYRIDKKDGDDTTIIKKAKEENRILLTFDKDFGEAYYFFEKGKITIITLYLKDQRYENVNLILKKFISTVDVSSIKNKLIILYEERYRIIN